jgi:hypothetical protein
MNFLLTCHELWWLDTPKGITQGMRKELEVARCAGLRVYRVTRDIFGGFMFEETPANEGVDPVAIPS